MFPFHGITSAQAFGIISLLALAPTQAEPPFALAQVAALMLFIVLGVLAVKRFRGASIAPTARTV